MSRLTHWTSVAVATLVISVVPYVVSDFSRTPVRSAAGTMYAAEAAVSAQAGRSVADGVYTGDQARRGREQYRKRCILCHLDNGQGRQAEPVIVGQSLEREGDAEAPPVAGGVFLMKWSGRTMKALYDTMSKTMPVGSAGSLSAQEYADVLAYLLELSKLPAGQQELPAAPDQLELITIKR
jgi:cytochrome c